MPLPEHARPGFMTHCNGRPARMSVLRCQAAAFCGRWGKYFAYYLGFFSLRATPEMHVAFAWHSLFLFAVYSSSFIYSLVYLLCNGLISSRQNWIYIAVCVAGTWLII